MNQPAKLLIVDDEPNMVLVLEDAVSALGFEVQTAATYSAALEALKSFQPNVVLCDLRLDVGTGLDLFDFAHTLALQPEFVFLSGHGTIEAAVQALKEGAFDFLLKPVTDERLATVLTAARTRAFEGSSSKDKNASNISLRDELEGHERQLIVDALERNAWVQAKAARELGLERSHLHYKIRKYGLSKPGSQKTEGVVEDKASAE